MLENLQYKVEEAFGTIFGFLVGMALALVIIAVLMYSQVAIKIHGQYHVLTLEPILSLANSGPGTPSTPPGTPGGPGGTSVDGTRYYRATERIEDDGLEGEIDPGGDIFDETEDPPEDLDPNL